jgi:hypothetical protein
VNGASTWYSTIKNILIMNVRHLRFLAPLHAIIQSESAISEQFLPALRIVDRANNPESRPCLEQTKM